MEIVVNLSKVDLLRFNFSLLPRLKGTYVTVALVVLIASYMHVSDRGFPSTTEESWAAAGAIATFSTVSLLVLGAWLVFWALYLSGKREGVLGEHIYTILPDGFLEKTSVNETHSSWNDVLDVCIVGELLLFQVSHNHFHVIPSKAFNSHDEFEEYVSLAMTYWENHEPKEGKTQEMRESSFYSGGSPKKAVGELLINMFRNLYAGFIALVRPASNMNHFKPGLIQFLVGMVISVLVVATFDYVGEDGDPQFNLFALYSLGFVFLLTIVSVLAVSGIHGDYSNLPILLTKCFYILPWYLFAVYGLKDHLAFLSKHTLVWWFVIGWGMIACIAVIRTTFDPPKSAASFLVMAVALMLTVMIRENFLYIKLFYSYTGEWDKYVDVDKERTYYVQDSLVRRKVADLYAQNPGVTDMFFLGFAGDGDQEIFNREVHYAQSVIDREYDTRGRSAVLVNDLEKLDTEPLANTYNLELIIDSVGNLMDVDEDILFLFLSSHGSDDATLKVSLYPFEMQDVQAADLKRYLDDAKVQWRVIVISACYSGSFIDSMADEYTMMVTAAASDRTSFGCSDDRELTNFGEALFEHALHDGKSLEEAFQDAKSELSQRELDEELTPSNPQIFIGEAIKKKLSEIWPTTIASNSGI